MTEHLEGNFRTTQDGLFTEVYLGGKWIRQLSPEEERMRALIREEMNSQRMEDLEDNLEKLKQELRDDINSLRRLVLRVFGV